MPACAFEIDERGEATSCRQEVSRLALFEDLAGFRPYHWTDQCVRGVEGASLVQIARDEAEANRTLRPCARGGKGRSFYRDVPRSGGETASGETRE